MDIKIFLHNRDTCMNTIYDIVPSLTTAQLKELSECILSRLYGTTWSLHFRQDEPLEELNPDFWNSLPEGESIQKVGTKPLQGIYTRLMKSKVPCSHVRHYITQRCPQSQQKSWFAGFECTPCHNQMCEHPREDYMTCADCFVKVQCNPCFKGACHKRLSVPAPNSNTHSVECAACKWHTTICNACEKRICLCRTCDSDVCICQAL